MESALGGIGLFGALFILLLALALILMPFFIWGIHNQTTKTARELTTIRKLLEKRGTP